MYRKNKKALHFTCLTCEDLNEVNKSCYLLSEAAKESEPKQIIHGLMDILASMLNVSMVKDRAICGDILERCGGVFVGVLTFRADFETLKKAKISLT